MTGAARLAAGAAHRAGAGLVTILAPDAAAAALYRAGDPNQFRLKIGDLHYADLAFPLGVQRGTKASVQLLGNFPAEQRVTVDATAATEDLLAQPDAGIHLRA